MMMMMVWDTCKV